MKMAPICPRCGGPLTEPSPWASAWRCALHGEVYCGPARRESSSSRPCPCVTCAIPGWTWTCRSAPPRPACRGQAL